MRGAPSPFHILSFIMPLGCFAGRPMGKALLFDSWRASSAPRDSPSSSSPSASTSAPPPPPFFLGRPLLPDLTEEESGRLGEAAQRDDEAVRSQADHVRRLKVQEGLGNKVRGLSPGHCISTFSVYVSYII